jgi:hypothetical protein
MRAASLTIDRKNKTITIVLVLETARPSKATGKTMLIASTRGLRASRETYARRPVYFTANVLYFPAKPKHTHGAHREFSRELEDGDAPEWPRKSRAKRNERDLEPKLRGALSDQATRRTYSDPQEK